MQKKAASKRIVNFISKFSFFFFFNGNWWKLSRYGKHFLILCFIFLIYFQIRSQKQQKKDVEPIYATKIPHMTIFWITTAKQILVSILIWGFWGKSNPLINDQLEIDLLKIESVKYRSVNCRLFRESRQHVIMLCRQTKICNWNLIAF